MYYTLYNLYTKEVKNTCIVIYCTVLFTYKDFACICLSEFIYINVTTYLSILVFTIMKLFFPKKPDSTIKTCTMWLT